MRVLFLTTTYPTPESPVLGTFVREHAHAAATRCDVSVVHLDRTAGRGAYDVTRTDDEVVPTWRVRYRRLPRPFSYLAAAAGTLTAVRRAGRPDVIHANSIASALVAVALGFVLRVPVVYTEHWTIFLREDPGELTPAMRRLAAFALRRADLVLPVSASLRNALAELEPQARFEVVPNVVDVTLFHADGQVDPDRLLTVGLLEDDQKGVDVLLDALASLPPTLGLDIVGDGARRAAYESRARELGISDRVAFLGRLSKDDVARLMRNAGAFVLASRYENNPVVVLEALCSGTPVVATDVGGVGEIVGPEDGTLVPREDAVALATTIRNVLSRKADRTAIAARGQARFGTDAVAERLERAYRAVARRV
jgi:glycosyltransferase involved in cell wall biosynthesis